MVGHQGREKDNFDSDIVNFNLEGNVSPPHRHFKQGND